MVRVLGRCEVEINGTTVPLSRKQAELFGLLAYRRAPLPRAEVASILWPDHPEADARHNLRQTLLALRARLGGACVLRDEDGALSLAIPTDLDALRDGEPTRQAPLLAGVSAEWLDAARADLDRRRVESALRHGAASLPHDPARALAFAEVAVALEPDLESPRSLAVRAHLARGDRAAALREVASFERRIAEELGGATPSGLRALLEPPLPLDVAGVDPALLGGGARLRLTLALVPSLTHRPVAARRALEAALAKAGEISEEERARAEAILAGLAMEAGDQAAAEDTAQRALARTESAPGARALALAVWSRVLFRTYRVDESLQAVDESLRRTSETGDVDARLRALGTRGAIYAMLHRLSEAETDLRSAVALARACDDPWALTMARYNLAVCHFYAGRLDAANEEYESVLRESPPAYHAHVQIALARARESQNRLSEAAALYEGAVERLREEERPFLLAQALTGRADLAARRGEREAARRDYKEAVVLRRTLGDRLGLMSAYKGLGSLAHAEGRLPVAERDLREALRNSRETGEPTGGASVRLALARLLADAGRPDEALAEARRARRGILGLRAEAGSLTDDDTLSLAAADRLIESLGSLSAPKNLVEIRGS